jgi:hypothetical protein
MAGDLAAEPSPAGLMSGTGFWQDPRVVWGSRAVMDPKCGHCGSSQYRAVKCESGGVKLVLVVCSSCGAILGAANAPSS